MGRGHLERELGPAPEALEALGAPPLRLRALRQTQARGGPGLRRRVRLLRAASRRAGRRLGRLRQRELRAVWLAHVRAPRVPRLHVGGRVTKRGHALLKNLAISILAGMVAAALGLSWPLAFVVAVNVGLAFMYWAEREE